MSFETGEIAAPSTGWIRNCESNGSELFPKTSTNWLRETVLNARRIVFAGMATTLLSSLAVPQPSMAQSITSQSTKPNIIVILVDDMGYADNSVYPGGRFATPNIDRIAREGVSFTAGYATAPVCAPSRAGLMTGRYQQRFGFEYNDGPARRDVTQGLGLDPHELTIANLLKDAGYHKGAIGKWHLGSQPQFYPTNRGFDEFVGFLPGQTSYIAPSLPGVHMSYGPDIGDTILSENRLTPAQINDLRSEMHIPDTVGDAKLQKRVARMRRTFTRRSLEQIVEGPDHAVVRNENEYLTDYWGDRAVDYIQRNAKTGKPYFLYLAFNAVHSPHMVTEKYYARFASIKDHQTRVYAAMVAALDDQVGRVLDAVKASGQDKNTLIFFASDNGCEMYFKNLCTCVPLRGGKLSDYKGGIRIPFMIRWPDRIKAGTVYDKPVSLLDVLPTSVAAAGAKLPADRAYDGVDLLPFLTSKATGAPHDTLFWRRAPLVAVRKGDWKLWESVDGKSGKYGSYKLLFNLKDDLNETTNLAASHPDKVKELEALIARWSKNKISAKWQADCNVQRLRTNLHVADLGMS